MTDVETPTFGGNALIHSAQFIKTETSSTLGMCLNGSVWKHALALYLMIQICRSISGTCSLNELVLSFI